jgi:hypothetical protein
MAWVQVALVAAMAWVLAWVQVALVAAMAWVVAWVQVAVASVHSPKAQYEFF